MTSNPLSTLIERLEQTGTGVSEFLYAHYGEQVALALVKAGVIRPEASALLRQPGPVERNLDLFAVRALYGDCLTLVTLACLNAGGAVNWERFEGVRPLLQRISSFLATVSGRYKDFRALPRERVPALLETFAADDEPFGLLHEATRFTGLRLCVHVTRQRPDPSLLNVYVDRVLRPLWQWLCSLAEVPPERNQEIWADLRASIDRL
jgi:hypothetical protein